MITLLLVAHTGSRRTFWHSWRSLHKCRTKLRIQITNCLCFAKAALVSSLKILSNHSKHGVDCFCITGHECMAQRKIVRVNFVGPRSITAFAWIIPWLSWAVTPQTRLKGNWVCVPVVSPLFHFLITAEISTTLFCKFLKTGPLCSSILISTTMRMSSVGLWPEVTINTCRLFDTIHVRFHSVISCGLYTTVFKKAPGASPWFIQRLTVSKVLRVLPKAKLGSTYARLHLCHFLPCGWSGWRALEQLGLVLFLVSFHYVQSFGVRLGTLEAHCYMNLARPFPSVEETLLVFIGWLAHTQVVCRFLKTDMIWRITTLTLCDLQPKPSL